MQDASSAQISFGVWSVLILAILFKYFGSFALRSPSQLICPFIKKASKYDKEIKSSLRDCPKLITLKLLTFLLKGGYTCE